MSKDFTKDSAASSPTADSITSVAEPAASEALSSTVVLETDAPASNTAKKSSKNADKTPFYKNLAFQILVGLAVGLVLGFIAQGQDKDSTLRTWLNLIGGSYTTLLRVVVVPLVFTAVVTSIARLREIANAAQLIVQTIIWFAITAFLSVTASIVIGVVLNPGGSAGVSQAAAAAPSRTGSWLAFIEGLIPNNLFAIQASESGSISTSMIQLLFIAVITGIAALKTGKKSDAFVDVSQSILDITLTILWWVILLAPIGTAALIGRNVANFGMDVILSLGSFVFAIYLGLLVVIGVIYPGILAFHGLSVRQFFANIWPVTSLGFITRSSMSVLPINLAATEKNMGVPRSYASVAVPLGATTKMDGCASVFPSIAAIFVAQFYGIELSAMQYVIIAAVSIFGSIATAGTTGATTMLTLTLSTAGLPLEGVGLLIAIDPLLDMGRTAVNVTGQSLVAVIVAKRSKILDQSVYDSPAVVGGGSINSQLNY